MQSESIAGPNSQSASPLSSVKPKRWFAIAGFTLLATSVVALVAYFVLGSQDSAREMNGVPFSAAAGTRPVAQPIVPSALQPSADVSVAPALPQPSVLDSPVPPKSSSAPGRVIAPIREKVDKRRASELQENPYR